MAWVTRGAGSGYWATVTLVDTQGDPTTLEFELQSADFATAQTDLATIITALAATSGSVPLSRSISFRQDEDAFAYPSGADNSVKARCVYQIANSSKKAYRDIPAPLDAIMVATTGPNNNVVNTVSAGYLLWEGLFLAGAQAYLSDGENVDTTLKGRRVTRAKGLS